MAQVVDRGSYVRQVPSTWEEHHAFHAYMKMYCGFNKEQSVAYAKEHLGPAPAVVTVNQIEIVPDDNDIE
ncbi:hypothetical protein Tola_0727 [Tolumonas auensis DSM 9187]|uniref:Uncharacterized protein n=1 Tax=Tolumonas auensis (strain DSM 9187 / NBRC 110442 / TA 4) TaxID=595494 RepID=C4LBC0_TOLAT|nr:hypothetical protein [Tolumonas auensis]ACQ92355.1 hypothetical protein Tola_0727 [Tolumonas auensis DSM 9187]